MIWAAVARRRWPAAALVASLVLNGFLIGMLTTDFLRPHHGPSPERLAGFELRRLSDHLPDDAVEQIRAGLAPLRPQVAARFDNLRAIREGINYLAAAPQPDRAAIDAQLAALRAESAAMQEDVQRATYDALLALPPEVRAGLASPLREE